MVKVLGFKAIFERFYRPPKIGFFCFCPATKQRAARSLNWRRCSVFLYLNQRHAFPSLRGAVLMSGGRCILLWYLVPPTSSHPLFSSTRGAGTHLFYLVLYITLDFNPYCLLHDFLMNYWTCIWDELNTFTPSKLHVFIMILSALFLLPLVLDYILHTQR